MDKEKILKLTNKSKDFYQYMGKFFGSRVVQNIINDRIYDDTGKTWYLYLTNEKVVAFVSMVGGVIKNIYAVKDEYLIKLLENLKNEVMIEPSIVPVIYEEIYTKCGFTITSRGLKNFITISIENNELINQDKLEVEGSMV